MEKGVLIYSGGVDSTTLLYHLRNVGDEVLPLGIDYGQRHVKELDHAADICAAFGLRYRIADLSSIREFIAGESSQVNPDVPVPEGHYTAENMKATVVPNRNMIMLSVALGYAISNKADYVAYAAHAGDHAIYPDCRPEFADALDKAARLADWQVVSIKRPFISISKAQIVGLGASLGVPYGKTWSCYKSGSTHCGRCGTCVERKEAFRLAKVVDPTPYEDALFAIPAFRG